MCIYFYPQDILSCNINIQIKVSMFNPVIVVAAVEAAAAALDC